MRDDEDKVEIKCEICETRFKINSYGKASCPKCGTTHQWDEAYRALLSDEQIATLQTGIHFNPKMGYITLPSGGGQVHFRVRDQELQWDPDLHYPCANRQATAIEIALYAAFLGAQRPA